MNERSLRKRVLCCVILALIMVSVCACGEPKTAPACVEITEQIRNAAPFQTLTATSEKYILRHLLLDAEQLEDSSLLSDETGATPEMILAVKAASEKELSAVKEAVQEYLDEMLLQYRDYQPDQMPKLENATVRVFGTTVVLIVSPDKVKTDKVLEKLLK